MKKVYIKPEIKKEEIKILDVITVSIVYDKSRWTSISVGGIDGEKFR